MGDESPYRIEHDVLRRGSTIRWWLPKVRHVPRCSASVWVSDTVVEDAMPSLADTVLRIIEENQRRSEVEWPAICRDVLRRRARRVRMARKRRRGWA